MYCNLFLYLSMKHKESFWNMFGKYIEAALKRIIF